MTDFDRRSLMKITAGAAGGLLLGFHLEDTADAASEGWKANAWLRIERDGALVFVLDKAEMGQGVHTSLPTILAEELDVDPERLVIETAPVNRRYGNPSVSGLQITGGSSSVATTFQPLRKAGATARQLLIQAAAATWAVKADECSTSDGKVIHKASNRSATYGELAAKAAKLPEPKAVRLKARDEFKRIGQPRARLDGPDKVQGKATFGLDVVVPGLHHAAVLLAPGPGAGFKTFEAAKARAMPGVVEVVPFTRGIAVIAKKFWQAKAALAEIKAEWTPGSRGHLSSEAIFKDYVERADQSIHKLKKHKDAWGRFISPKHAVEAEYQIPFQAHMAMEPINCTARVSKTECEIWAPTQAAGLARQVALETTGLKPEAIQVHTTFLGGGFGRRLYQDFVRDTLEIAKASGYTVKMIWTREDDLKHDFYRPGSVHRLAAALDEDGTPMAWAHSISGQSILSDTLPDWLKAMLPTWMPSGMKSAAGSLSHSLINIVGQDPTSVEGADALPYEVGQALVDYQLIDSGIPIGFWRSVGHSYTGFVVESFVDELAHAAKMDPVEYRRKILAKGRDRYRAVLDLVVKKAGWGKALPANTGRGVAIHESFGSICAQVAEVEIKDGQIKVRRVVAAVDCGLVINPGHVQAQVMGAIIFGLSAALYDSVTFKNGAVEQNNFHDYRVMRFDEAPVIEVHTVDSDRDPKGIGEPGVPPVAAAVGNAIFGLTGKRLRSLPFKLT